MRRGEVTYRILEKLKSASLEFGDLFAALLEAGYGASIFKMEKTIERGLFGANHKEQRIVRGDYARIICKLKKEGFIKEEGQRGKKIFEITNLGRNKLENLSFRSFLPEVNYEKEKSKNTIIISFDIPEKLKRKREWLRRVLIALGFAMIQKSVWIGRVKIPEQFLDDLNDLKLISFIEIFEVGRTGSLKSII